VADADDLIASIKEQTTKPGVVCIDTLNRSLVGSESKDEDMAAYIAAAGKIEAEFGCLVIIVHHCGVDATRPRGHTSLTGAVEAQIAVKKNDSGVVSVTLERAKDLVEGTEIVSRLEQVNVGTDPDGDPMTSLVVVPGEKNPAHKIGDRLKPGPRKALECLYEALDDFGAVPPASSRIPPNIRTVASVRWRDVFEAKTVRSDTKPDTLRRTFDRHCERLQQLGIIGVWKDRVWMVGQFGQ
jgi:hypothetical protein